MNAEGVGMSYTIDTAGLVARRRQATDCRATLTPAARRELEPADLWDVLNCHLQPPRGVAAAASIEYSPGLTSSHGRDHVCAAHRLDPQRDAAQHCGPQWRR